MKKSVVFIDTEVGTSDGQIHDIGAVRQDGAYMRSASVRKLAQFIGDARFVCGHNIVNFDLVHIEKALGEELKAQAIDTLYLSPLLFPRRPYHSLLKDDKLQTDALNDPVNDSKKAAVLFYDEVNAFAKLSGGLKSIFCSLLFDSPEFHGFFIYEDQWPYDIELGELIKSEFEGKICANADLRPLIVRYPVELAYTLALINADDRYSVTPAWLLYNFPEIENVMRILRGVPCEKGCRYCNKIFDVHKALREFYGYENFRAYAGEPLQEKAVQAAVDGKSLLSVFPTGGGKSLTFQLPALMAGSTVHGLTVVISPLQSLMKDQVDNLADIGITDAVTVNGLLDPIERADALRRVQDGTASILYISPEQLRSRTIHKLLLSRNIVRFVIDEAHCFSAWGQDFRVDYLYIGDFIRGLQKEKLKKKPIPVSCFTATAKQKVITDICDYFRRKLGLDLEIYTTAAERENLHYTVLFRETEEEKYSTLRRLISARKCPAIVYVSTTRQTRELAERLTRDGFCALAFNGKMEPEEKVRNQDAFMKDQVRTIVATSAFGMGVDKKDVGLVVHYNISSSLEDYVQEAGRAGRSSDIQADCFVLYNDSDLDKHFMLLNQNKLSISEIQQVWKAIKDLTRQRRSICCSPLEIARQAGWDYAAYGIETRVKTAISALENAGYIKRGQNVPHVYATGILAANMAEASARIESSELYDDGQRESAKRIIKSLISSRSIAEAGNDDAESRVDYLADMLGLTTEEVINTVNLMRSDGLLEDSRDMSAYIFASDRENRSLQTLEHFAELEGFFLSQLDDEGRDTDLKELNEKAISAGISKSSIKDLRTLIYFYTIKDHIKKPIYRSAQTVEIVPAMELSKLMNKYQLRIELCRYILKSLYSASRQQEHEGPESERRPVEFSLVGLFNEYKSAAMGSIFAADLTMSDVEDALLYLSKTGAMRLEGGFLVLYNGMEIRRIVTDNRIKYKIDDYRYLDEFYKQKIRQIHIVGEYANLMVRDHDMALQYVHDYFQMDHQRFIGKYFEGDRKNDLDRNITPVKYDQLFGSLSYVQSQIINDADSKYIVVAAGPGSGKTWVLVCKLAALLLMEDVKQEQLLMLTFSRAAATEFKKRLVELIGSAAYYVDIKTFHSYCFDLLDRIGSLEGAEDIVQRAAELIRSGGAENSKIAKTVLVIDEAQDMDANEYELVQALMQYNDDMRVIAVGDDDQNIFGFRGADAKYMKALITEHGARKYEMTENYRSCARIVALSNAYASTMKERMKQQPSQAFNEEPGRVVITRHYGSNIAEAVANELVKDHGNESCCILTFTNEEALRMVGLLQKKGVDAKLIQSFDQFNMYDLVELRYFMQQIDSQAASPVISDETWTYAKDRLKEKYCSSTCLDMCMRLINDFEATNREKYRQDLTVFIKESKPEDFCDMQAALVYVSTIHKAKGREFDTVYMLIDGRSDSKEEEKRALYVGMTRAKSALYIHCSTDLFSSFRIPGVEHVTDTACYEEPAEIVIQLSHKDVVLDYFIGKDRMVAALRSGMHLSWYEHYLYADIKGTKKGVAKLSRAGREKVDTMIKKGYRPYDADVRYIVAWKPEEAEHESGVILPNIYMRKIL